MKLSENTNYSEQELEKADILDAYVSKLKGERLSRKQKKLLQNHNYADEIAPLKRVVDFAHEQSTVTMNYALPCPGATSRVEMALLDSIRNDRIPATVFGTQPQMASHQQVGGESEIEQLEYDYEIVAFPTQVPPEVLSLKFVLVEGDEAGEEYTLTLPEVTLGRGENVAIKLEDSKISRSHARLEAQAGLLYITDLNSSNGTYVNEQKIISSTELEVGSIIKMGNLLLLVSSIESDEQGKLAVTLREPSDNSIGREYNVTIEETTIGRSTDARIQLIDSTEKMSRVHARLQAKDNEVYIIDLHSSNGTYVDGVPITEGRLDVGANVKLGGVVIRILSIE